MAIRRSIVAAAGLVAGTVAVVAATQGGGAQMPQTQAAQTQAPPDDVATLVGHLELEKYKAMIKGLTQFGDRREGTQRNRDAVAWIEAQLKSYGCSNVERMQYTPPQRGGGGGQRAGGGGVGAAGAVGAAGGATAAGAAGAAQTGQRAGGQGAQTGAAQTGQAGAAQAGQAQAGQRGAGGGGGGGGRGGNFGPLPAPVRTGEGGSTLYGNRGRRSGGAPDERLKELNAGPVLPPPFEMVYCTKIGTTRPDEMYIIGGHMDGIGNGEAANDDASGSALVMELARIFHTPGVQTERSIRFALWNGEEGGLNAATAYVEQRQKLQGIEEPKGSRRYPEPKWLGMIQHDMMMFDHGMPRADGTLSPDQRPEADFNVEWQNNSKMAEASMKLALTVKLAADKYSTDYPGTLGPHMTNTDSRPFQDIIPAISLRENERGMHTGVGWNPHWHQATDVFTTFSDKDFRLGLNAAQATLSAIAQLTGAAIKK
jgi:hypothetical protein